ncbi:hypothetical protein HPB48_016111 [Haemaphysalis longicornis]|uniref:Gustatory receptor n=1 Tax=Haemaphysalis longicornis TaxID=44386 RepID=A0A9J6GZV8_HAELO|nr:hypothetical protein HPB48_016111 [Haemaphysalis longicornis]
MECYMIRSFSRYEILCRVFGCSFLQNMTEKTVHRANATWKRPYTFYSLAWILAITYFEGRTIAVRVQRSDVVREFTESLTALVHAALTVKVVVNFVTMVASSPRLLDFFRKCAEFEKSSGFRPPRLQDVRRSTYSAVVLRNLILFGVATCYCFVVVAFYAGNPAAHGKWTFASGIINLACWVGYLLYESLPYVVLASTGEVLVWYVRAQTEAFDECLKVVGGQSVTSLARLSPSAKVESVRLNVIEITRLKNCINEIWNPALAVASVLLLWTHSMTLYSLICTDAYALFVYQCCAYTAYSSLSFLHIVLISQGLRDEMVGTLITYAVILVQTSDNLSQRRHANGTISVP